MVITIEFHDPKPAYLQIRDQIVAGLARGDLPAGTRLPSIRQLGQDLGLNLHTVNKAYDLLRAEGLVVLTHREGATVHVTATPSENFHRRWTKDIAVLLAEAWVQGLSRAEIQSAIDTVLETFTDKSLEASEAQASSALKPLKKGSL